MSGERKYGYDQPYYDWSPISTRPKLTWPNKARLALCVIISVEHYEWIATNNFADGGLPGALPEYSHKSLELPGGVSSSGRPYPDVMSYGQREYGTKATGSKPLGWFGPEYGESENTVAILADEGIKYVCDWPNDEQPYPMKTSTGSIYSLPILLSLDDQFTHWINKIQIDSYAKMITDSFDVLYRESAETGRMMVLNFHPWIMGTPFRSKYLEIALSHISKHDGIWNATASEIVDWHREQSSK